MIVSRLQLGTGTSVDGQVVQLWIPLTALSLAVVVSSTRSVGARDTLEVTAVSRPWRPAPVAKKVIIVDTA